MKKRKYKALVTYPYRDENTIIISYIDKKYTAYDYNENGSYIFFPDGVKIEKSDIENSYFTRFGRLYKHYCMAINCNRDKNKVPSLKRYNRRINCPVIDNDFARTFDDLDSAKLWLEIREKEKYKEEKEGEIPMPYCDSNSL